MQIGLNRFYVAQEHPELLDAFQYPPNVFDDYTKSQQIEAELRAQKAETALIRNQKESFVS